MGSTTHLAWSPSGESIMFQKLSRKSVSGERIMFMTKHLTLTNIYMFKKKEKVGYFVHETEHNQSTMFGV